MNKKHLTILLILTVILIGCSKQSNNDYDVIKAEFEDRANYLELIKEQVLKRKNLEETIKESSPNVNEIIHMHEEFNRSCTSIRTPQEIDIFRIEYRCSCGEILRTIYSYSDEY